MMSSTRFSGALRRHAAQKRKGYNEGGLGRAADLLTLPRSFSSAPGKEAHLAYLTLDEMQAIRDAGLGFSDMGSGEEVLPGQYQHMGPGGQVPSFNGEGSAGGAGESGGGGFGGIADSFMGGLMGAHGFGNTGLGFGGFGTTLGGITAVGDMVGKAARGAGMDVSDPTSFAGDDTGISNDPSQFGGGDQGNDVGPGSEPLQIGQMQKMPQQLMLQQLREQLMLQQRRDAQDYANRYDDLRGMAWNDALKHYQRYGQKEGRIFGSNDHVDRLKAAYLEQNPDVAAAGMDALEHYQNHGHAEGRVWGAPTRSDGAMTRVMAAQGAGEGGAPQAPARPDVLGPLQPGGGRGGINPGILDALRNTVLPTHGDTLTGAVPLGLATPSPQAPARPDASRRQMELLSSARPDGGLARGGRLGLKGGGRVADLLTLPRSFSSAPGKEAHLAYLTLDEMQAIRDAGLGFSDKGSGEEVLPGQYQHMGPGGQVPSFNGEGSSEGMGGHGVGGDGTGADDTGSETNETSAGDFGSEGGPNEFPGSYFGGMSEDDIRALIEEILGSQPTRAEGQTAQLNRMYGLPDTALSAEDHYLQQRPDVAAAIAEGHFANAREHYDQFGVNENMQWAPRPVGDPRAHVEQYNNRVPSMAEIASMNMPPQGQALSTGTPGLDSLINKGAATMGYKMRRGGRIGALRRARNGYAVGGQPDPGVDPPVTPGMVSAPGDGTSDSRQNVSLSHEEYVVPADVVSDLGNGSSEAGGRVLDDMVMRTRQQGVMKRLGSPPPHGSDYA